MTVKSPVDALATVRTRHDRIDLVLTDLHMPEMNGIELQRQIEEEFKHLPVIIMSSDDRESVILESLASGAVFYIVKPINPDDLKNVWQYAITSKKGKSLYIEDIGSIQFGGSLAHEDISSASSVNEERHVKKKDHKRKAIKKGKDYMEGENSVAPKKAKVVWTNSLHNRFLQAIKLISLEKAVPKKILECMNVPGLTRENVASHLQKYRLFLKRVAEKGIIVTTKNFSSRNVMSSTFAKSGQSSLQLKHAQQDNKQFQGRQPTRTSFQLAGYGGSTSALNGGNIGSRQGYVSQLGLQLGNEANLYQPNFGTTNPLGQANLPTFGMGSNDFGNNLFSLGGMPGGLLNGTNPMQMYPQQSQARPDMNFGTPGIINLPPNYAGMSITDDMELSPIGQMALDGNFLNAGCGLINPAHNDNMNIGPAGSATFGYFPPGESSSTEFDRANYPFQPAFASVNQQESTPILPPLQQYGLGRNNGQNNFTSDLMNNASVFGNPQQLREGNISDILSGTTNCLFPYQQQGSEGGPNPNFPTRSNFAEMNPPGNLSLNLDFSSAFGVEENDPRLNNEPTLDQLQEIEEAMNPDLENGNNPMDDYFPMFNENLDQQQGNEGQVNSELNYLLMDTALSGNQEWDEFLNSLFKDHPF
ncbi:two-component response regulator ARR2-like [Pistacia vera]|uniref:two-component response regulator ARR2-like n=1 Tax=Pistacia vera TaxID=55513 RepID=UPI001263939E|nr:two-component response regulator ARR2-like [Pistacia vera]XP_031280494.1 two-component response regulator ARR2-like [Pistacia vera]